MTPDWKKLTFEQEQTLSAVCETGCLKTAASDLGITHQTILVRVCRARIAAGMQGTGSMRLFLEWDRHTRGQKS